MENYYCLSARSRKRILFMTFVKSWKWTFPSLLVATLAYILLHDVLKASHFNALLTLLTSFSLFAVVKYKNKLDKKKFFSFQICYALATSVILFWMMITLGFIKFTIFLSLALVLFLISPLINHLRLPFISSREKIIAMIYILIILALIADLIAAFFDIFTCHFASFVFCFGFMLLNALELKQMDKELQYGLTKTDIKNLTDNWSFDMFINFIGMIYYFEAVRLVAKMILSSQNPKIPEKAVSF